MADDFEAFFPSAPVEDNSPLPDAVEGGIEADQSRDAFARLSMTGKEREERLQRKQREILEKECPFKPHINKPSNDVHRPNDVFTNLYIQAQSQEQKRAKLIQSVEQKHQAENVFHPVINKNDSRERRDQSLACDQLYQHAMKQMKDKTKYSQDITRMDEECSFTPMLNPRSLKMAKKHGAPTSARLCPSQESIAEFEAEREQIKHSLEMDGCTFTPQTNKSAVKRTQKQTFEELYLKSKLRQEKLEKQRREKEKEDSKKYTHHPAITKTARHPGQSSDVYARLSMVKAASTEKHEDEDELTFKPNTLSKGRGYGTDRLYHKGVDMLKKRKEPESNLVEKSRN